MSVLDFEVREETKKENKPECPAKIIVLALARDHRGIRAKMLAETLHKRFPEVYQKPLIKFFHDMGWRDTLIRLREASKKWDYVAPVIVFVNKKLIGDDDDFNLFIREKHFLVADPKKINIFKNMGLLDKLRMDPLKTYVYFDIAIDYRPVGRMIFQVEADLMPQSTKGFLELCCSQKIPLPEHYHKRSRFAGGLICRIVREGWIRIQTIDDERVYANGKYEKPALTHDRRGTLSMNIGPRGWLSSHVIITFDQHPWMDKSYRALGTLIDGEHVLHLLENVGTTYETPNVDVVVTDNGILHSPNLMTTEGFLSPEMRDVAAKLKAFKEEYKKVLTAYVNSSPCLEPEVKEVKQPEEVEPPEVKGEELEMEGDVDEATGEVDLGPISEMSIGMAMPSTSVIGAAPSWRDKAGGMSKVAVWSQAIQKVKPEASVRSFKSAMSLSKRQLQPSSSNTKSLMSHASKKSIPVAALEEQAESEGIGEEEVEGEMRVGEPELSEPDIQYTYVVPKKMADIRTGYKKFEDGYHVETYRKVGMKLPKKSEYDRNKPLSDPSDEDFEYITPHERIEREDDKTPYYEIPQKTMTQVTPQLLLAWAQGIDDDAEVCEIEKAIDDLLNTALLGKGYTDLEGHSLDAISMENLDERFKECFLSLPTKLLQILKENLLDIKARQDGGTQPLLVKGDSSSNVLLETTRIGQTMRSPSEGVVSGCILSIIEFTKRMVESTTELVPDMKNLDFMLSLIDDVILEKVHRFIAKKQRKDKRFKKKLSYKYYQPSGTEAPYMKEVKKTPKTISYFLDTDELPTSSHLTLLSSGASIGQSSKESNSKNLKESSANTLKESSANTLKELSSKTLTSGEVKKYSY